MWAEYGVSGGVGPGVFPRQQIWNPVKLLETFFNALNSNTILIGRVNKSSALIGSETGFLFSWSEIFPEIFQ